MKKRLHLMIQGHVQGVCYRMYAREKAECLGLTGWIRNNDDGTVEVMAEGDEKDLKALAAWCRHGPPYSRVTGIGQEYSEATGEFSGFSING